MAPDLSLEDNLHPGDRLSYMVVTTQRDDMTWYECETCGLLFDDEGDASQHERNCDDEDPSYLQ